MSERERLYQIWCKATTEANEAISRRDAAKFNLQDGEVRSALGSAPDIAMYQPDEFYALYTKWFETVRRDALKN